MSDLKPLKPAVGSLAQGDQYFPRPMIRNKILRLLNNGDNILLSAPRRIGKSSLLKSIQANPEKGQIIKYLVIQSIASSDEFFRQLHRELITDQAIYSAAERSFKQASHTLSASLNRIRGISIEGFEIDAQDSINYYHECCQLIHHIDDKKIILFIDEFPDAVNNIAKIDRDLAIQFLQQHRDLRQQFSPKTLQIVYTGSTGLRNVVTKIGKLDLINDLNEIYMPTLSKAEAQALIERLVLHYQKEKAGFALSKYYIESILEKITWYLPYYLQAIVQSLFERYEDSDEFITQEDIETVLTGMTKTTSPCSSYFQNWLPRLEKNLKADEFQLAKAVLNHSAEHNSLDKQTLNAIRSSYPEVNYKTILQILKYDGYLNEDYRFNSNLLQKWWSENIAD